ncbi:MAG: LysE family transporter [Chloroflexota bacterium]|nr:LysE family transporter [Chloroflexota bacterium]
MAIYLLQGVMLALPTVLTPSPFRIYLITEVLQHGFRRTLPAIFAPAITDGPIILLVVLILSRMPQWMLDALRFGGGLYLLYLATNVVRLLRRTTGPTLRASGGQSARQSLGRAVVVNALNPNPYIFWTVVAGPILMLGLAQSLATGLAFLLGFYGVFFVGVTIVIWLFSAAGRINPAANRLLLGVSALGLALIGLMQIWGGARALAGL